MGQASKAASLEAVDGRDHRARRKDGLGRGFREAQCRHSVRGGMGGPGLFSREDCSEYVSRGQVSLRGQPVSGQRQVSLPDSTTRQARGNKGSRGRAHGDTQQPQSCPESLGMKADGLGTPDLKPVLSPGKPCMREMAQAWPSLATCRHMVSNTDFPECSRHY